MATAVRVLVTGALGPSGLSLCEQLRRRGLPVTGVDSDVPGDSATHEPGASTGVRAVPPPTDAQFVQRLGDEVQRAAATLVVPTAREELPVLADVAPRLCGARMLVAGRGAVVAADDKLETCRRLARAGVAVPWFVRGDRRVGSLAELPSGARLVVRPCVRTGLGMRLLPPGAVFPQLGRDVVVQEFVPGDEYSVNLHVRPAGGAVVAVLLRTALAPVVADGPAAVRRVHEADVGLVALAAARALGLTGPVEVDVRRRADGEPVVLEVNARFGAHSAHAPEVLDAVLAQEMTDTEGCVA